jgi:hypothetical protein
MTTRNQDDRSTRTTRTTVRTDVGVQPTEAPEVGIQPLQSPAGREFERLDAAELRYHQAHAAWTDALRASRSGGAAELARLGIAQRAYEEAKATFDRLTDEAAATDRRLARLRDERQATERRAAAIAAQADAWNRVRASKPPRRGLGGVVDRLFGRR